jgi:serine/threonine-protein kinase
MWNTADWVGQTVAGGRYELLERLDEGSMGLVFRAHDRRLDADAVIKFPAAMVSSLNAPELLARFDTEIRSLVRLSHPHVVKVIDVGEFEGLPYVVMQYLAGGSLKSRMESGPSREVRPMTPESLRGWLTTIAEALDFLHHEDHVHRDVKPGNILFDQHGNAFLGDLGLIKVLTDAGAAPRSGTMTAAGVMLGTPNYVAPEVVLGQDYGGRADQYSLALTVHEALAGRNVMQGPTPSATMVNHTNIVPPPLDEIDPAIPARLSDAVRRGLEKRPDDRFATCADFARAVLAGLSAPAPPSRPSRMASDLGASHEVISRRANCPQCGALIPVEPRLHGKRGRCGRCGALSLVEPTETGVMLRLVAPAKPLADIPWEEPELPAVRAQPVPAPAPPRRAPSEPPPLPAPRSQSRTRLVAACALALGLVAVSAWAISALRHRPAAGRAGTGASAPATALAGRPERDPAPAPAALPVAAKEEPVELHIAYGTEKKKWLEGALESFAATDAGRRMKVVLHGLGSVEGAQAVLDGPRPIPIHVWSPASSAYRAVFEHEWSVRHGGKPIARAENLAMTPMVFVMWKDRHEPFLKKYGKVSFTTLAEAMREPTGWSAIAGKPEWGHFKFSHTHPLKSNSGMLALVMMAYERTGKERELVVGDVMGSEFQDWLREFERSLARPGGSGGLSNSTGNQMREMVLRGPSQFDCLLLYENLAIDYLAEARDRWGELQVIYPEPSMWNENPYYILDVPWSNEARRAAAEAFLSYLMSGPIQQRALDHGFRPGDPSVAVRSAGSPLVRNEASGLRLDLLRMCNPPGAEVLNSLLTSFRRLEP